MTDSRSPDDSTKRTVRLWRPALTAIAIGGGFALAGFILVLVGLGASREGLYPPHPALFWLGLALGLPGSFVVWLGFRVSRS